MSIQGNFNNNLFQVAALTSMAKINETLSKFGISSIDELRSKIKDLEIEIAKAEDYGINPIKMSFYECYCDDCRSEADVTIDTGEMEMGGITFNNDKN